MLTFHNPKPSKFHIPWWALVFIAVLFMAMDLGSYHSKSPCETGISDVITDCDLDEPENLPPQPLAEEKPLDEAEPIYALFLCEGMRNPDLEVEHPPPRIAMVELTDGGNAQVKANHF